MQRLIMLLGAVLVLTAAPLWAENAERFDGYTIHYNAFNADLLDQRVAQAYKLRTGCSDGVLTLALRKDDGSSAAADITAGAVTLVGQRNGITMREVRDGKSVYYIGSFSIVSNAEPLKFAITVRPQGATREHSFDFTRQLFRC